MNLNRPRLVTKAFFFEFSSDNGTDQKACLTSNVQTMSDHHLMHRDTHPPWELHSYLSPPVHEAINLLKFVRHFKSSPFDTVICIHLISLSCHILVFAIVFYFYGVNVNFKYSLLV